MRLNVKEIISVIYRRGRYDEVSPGGKTGWREGEGDYLLLGTHMRLRRLITTKSHINMYCAYRHLRINGRVERRALCGRALKQRCII